MVKKGMKHDYSRHKKNMAAPVSIISSRAKSGKEKANPLITGADGKVYHGAALGEDKISAVFPAIDNDLAVENITNDFDMTAADLQDLQ